ncbi:hypothetical protein [Legionella worsleiensis]|uniref:Ankyrin repeats (3 copies) n=1 Tax=Legionella worsleiensis TaxID=45076 RepID=A0A0W1AFZ2_9GAMM|nr:hypothetical protein [Legionella worsleiensis]KTD80233.1 hypothetical protein Lwor_1141 [Legionella worsleiensis]STY31679.1 Uncharacterised protein [Legionella worsleiensis]
MTLKEILEQILLIKKYQTPSHTHAKNEQHRQRFAERDALRQSQATELLSSLLKRTKSQYGTDAADYIMEICAERRIYSFAASSSDPGTEPHPDASLYKEFYNNELYHKLLPLCCLACKIEKRGNPEDHALKLSLIFEDEQAVLFYLTNFPKGNKVEYLVRDACRFDLPDLKRCDFAQWKKIAAKQNNMLNPRFRDILAHAGAVEQFKKTIPSVRTEPKRVKEKEQELSRVMKTLNAEEKIRICAELTELTAGISLTDASFLVLHAFYERYRFNSTPAHQILMKYGHGEKSIASFYSLQRCNDDEAIPAILIKGSDLGYPNCYITKLNTKHKQGAALAACLGKVSHCCQYLGGVGDSCVRYGIESPNGGFYVMFRGDANNPSLDDKVLAQAWVWRSNDGTLCLDSVETAFVRYTTQISHMYRYLGMMLCEHYDVKRIHVGSTSGITDWVGHNDYPVGALLPIAYEGHNDSSRQFLLADPLMPYIFYGQKDSAALTDVIIEKTRSLFAQFFASTKELKHNELLKQVIARLIASHHGRENSPIIQTVLEIAGERTEEFLALLEVHRRYARILDNPYSQALFEEVCALINQGACIHVTNKEGKTALVWAAENYESLTTLLDLIPEHMKLDAVNVIDESGRTLLFYVVQKPELLRTVLEIYPKHQRRDAVMLIDYMGKTLLHHAATQIDSLLLLIPVYSPQDLLHVLRMKDSNRKTVLHWAAKNPETLKVVLCLYPEKERFDEVIKADKLHQSTLNYAARNPESFIVLLECLPQIDRIEILNEIKKDDNQQLISLVKNPKFLRTMLELLTPEQRIRAMRPQGRRERAVYNSIVRNPECLSVLHELVPELFMSGVAQKSSSSRAAFSEENRNTFFGVSTPKKEVRLADDENKDTGSELSMPP